MEHRDVAISVWELQRKSYLSCILKNVCLAYCQVSDYFNYSLSESEIIS